MSDHLHRSGFWPAYRRPGRAPAAPRRRALRLAPMLIVAVLLTGMTGREPAGAARTVVPSFRYDAEHASITTVSTRTTADCVERDVQLTSPGGAFAATLVRPLEGGRHAGVVFVHWLGDPATTNRSEFMSDARGRVLRMSATILVRCMTRCSPAWTRARRRTCS